MRQDSLFEMISKTVNLLDELLGKPDDSTLVRTYKQGSDVFCALKLIEIGVR